MFEESARQNQYIHTWIFHVCKICAFSPEKPTKRQTCYISGRSRYIYFLVRFLFRKNDIRKRLSFMLANSNSTLRIMSTLRIGDLKTGGDWRSQKITCKKTHFYTSKPLTQPMAKQLKLSGITLFSRKNKPFKLLSQGPLAEGSDS